MYVAHVRFHVCVWRGFHEHTHISFVQFNAIIDRARATQMCSVSAVAVGLSNNNRLRSVRLAIVLRVGWSVCVYIVPPDVGQLVCLM